MFNKQPEQWYEVFETRTDGTKETLFRSSNYAACVDYVNRNRYFKRLNIDQWKRMKHGAVVVKNMDAVNC